LRVFHCRTASPPDAYSGYLVFAIARNATLCILDDV
jgi:hypothetical protein